MKLSFLLYFFVMAAEYDINIAQMDAISAFLQDNIDEEINMIQPPRYEKGTNVQLLKTIV